MQDYRFDLPRHKAEMLHYDDKAKNAGYRKGEEYFIMPLVQQPLAQMRIRKTGTACYEDTFLYLQDSAQEPVCAVASRLFALLVTRRSVFVKCSYRRTSLNSILKTRCWRRRMRRR